MKRRLILSLAASLIFASASARQPSQDRPTTATKKSNEQRQAPARERRGTIKGRVVTDGGQPLAFVGINVAPSGSTSVNRRSVGTDEEGKFEVDDLAPAAYTVTASVPGYTASPASPNERKTFRIGETATLTMIKGGVITGAVKSAAGEPLINVPVRALRVKDADGRPTRSQYYIRERQTDDRGIYRLYGLEPGTYLVIAGGTSNQYSGYNKYGEDVPTYYPSATRDTAVEVVVQAGQEDTGIDIAYRGDKGHAVSGMLAGSLPPGMNTSVNISLLNGTTGVLESSAVINYQDEKRGFAFTGIPDGDYLLLAEAYNYSNEKDFAASHTRRLTVKGADVTGLELPLSPMASIAGRVVLEPATAADSRAKCESKREAAVEETMLAFLRETRGELTTPGWMRGTVPTAVDDKGAFAAYRLYADRYRIDVNLPSENWYVRSIALGDAPGRAALPRNASANDVVSKGVALKAGDKIDNLTITLTEGAAVVTGKVVATSEGEKLPARLRVYLVPAERERADEMLRYGQAEAAGDGSFAFANLAPGKYWLLTKEPPAEELNAGAPPPVFWEAAGRAALRKEAEAANATIDLQSCQQLKEFRLRYSAAAKPATKKL